MISPRRRLLLLLASSTPVYPAFCVSLSTSDIKLIWRPVINGSIKIEIEFPLAFQLCSKFLAKLLRPPPCRRISPASYSVASLPTNHCYTAAAYIERPDRESRYRMGFDCSPRPTGEASSTCSSRNARRKLRSFPQASVS